MGELLKDRLIKRYKLVIEAKSVGVIPDDISASEFSVYAPSHGNASYHGIMNASSNNITDRFVAGSYISKLPDAKTATISVVDRKLNILNNTTSTIEFYIVVIKYSWY